VEDLKLPNFGDSLKISTGKQPRGVLMAQEREYNPPRSRKPGCPGAAMGTPGKYEVVKKPPGYMRVEGTRKRPLNG